MVTTFSSHFVPLISSPFSLFLCSVPVCTRTPPPLLIVSFNLHYLTIYPIYHPLRSPIRMAVRQLERLLCMAQKTDDQNHQPPQSTTTTSTAASLGTTTSQPPLSTSVPLPPATTAASSSLSSYDLTGHSIYIHTSFSSILL